MPRPRILLVVCGCLVTGLPVRAQNLKAPVPRTLIFELSRSERTIWGIGVGSSIAWGSVVVNGYYRPPAAGPLPYPDLVTADYIDAGGVLQEVRDYGTVYFNAKWLFPLYKIVHGSAGLGLETRRKMEIYYVSDTQFRYGLLKSTQFGAGLAGLSARLTRNFSLTCEYHTRLRWLASLDFHWQIR